MNAVEVLIEVEKLIAMRGSYLTSSVCERLSIFDWWVDTISQTKLQDMKKFLQEAIKLGYTGYACFKVGATGCANGMWAYKEESEDGFSPKECEYLYKSFTPDYTYWNVYYEDCTDLAERVGKKFDALKSAKALEEAIVESEVIEQLKRNTKK